MPPCCSTLKRKEKEPKKGEYVVQLERKKIQDVDRMGNGRA